MQFELKADFAPAGDQPQAIAQLVDAIKHGRKHQTLLGVTGSGKTFTMANVIQQVQMPTLVISHNKTLAAQLYQEFKEFFPNNAVEYFVSFYDYYQPEAYIPSSDTYIEKTAEINEELDRLRLKSTSSLMSRKDVIIVASVSCIYNIGSPDSYEASSVSLVKGQTLDRREFLQQLTRMQYTRNDWSLERKCFRVRGDVVELQPAYEDTALRVETFGDQVESIKRIQVLDGKTICDLDSVTIFPAKHFITTRVTIEQAVNQIYHELEEQLAKFKAQGKLLEAQRLEQRTLYDVEMMREVGYVSGIENYSRILDGRAPGSKPYCLIDFFDPPFLTIVDESHVSVSQIQGMYNGDTARKTTLVEHGFRLPCALDNRPLRFEEFEKLMDYVVYVSATPADFELKKCEGVVVEQLIRPTGLIDPPIEVRPATNQVDDLIEQLRKVVESKQRALVTTLTKRSAEDLSEYLEQVDFKVRYLHSEVETLERSEIIRDLRLGEFDVLVGINLLREGLDLPEVALVAILDADKEGFLRSVRSIIQIAGRAARNLEGRIILYADKITDSIRKALEETERRRVKQVAYNREHDVVPVGIKRGVREHLLASVAADERVQDRVAERMAKYGAEPPTRGKGRKVRVESPATVEELEKEMASAAANLEFEKAAKIRDRIMLLRDKK
jgi:excinuclease ABC subunit B